MGSERILEDVGFWNAARTSSSPLDVDVGVDEDEVDLSASEREE